MFNFYLKLRTKTAISTTLLFGTDDLNTPILLVLHTAQSRQKKNKSPLKMIEIQ